MAEEYSPIFELESGNNKPAVRPNIFNQLRSRIDRAKNRDLEIVNTLESGEVIRQTELGGGRNKTYLIDIKDDGSAVFKPKSGEVYMGLQELYKRERAAYLVDEALEFNLVPPTVIRTVDGQVGSVQQFIESTNFPDRWIIGQSKIQEQLYKMRIFDYIIYNGDRHPGNYLIRHNRIVAIDHGISFGYLEHFPLGHGKFWSEDAPADLVTCLKAFSEDIQKQNLLRHKLGELLLPEEIEATLNRISYITAILTKDGRILPSELFLYNPITNVQS